VESKQIITGNWKAGKAQELFKTQYAADPAINIVWCANDAMALGVVDVVHELELKQKILIGGANWDSRALQTIDLGRMHPVVRMHDEMDWRR